MCLYHALIVCDVYKKIAIRLFESDKATLARHLND